MPTPQSSKTITDVERDKILDWLAKDAQAKALIDRKVSPVVASLLDESHTARQQWERLSQYYSCSDILSQYELRARIRSEKLKDADDATHYIGVFKDAHRRFLQMGVSCTVEESIFDLLQGLPSGVEWETLRELTLRKLSSSATSSSTSTSTTSPSAPSFSFDDATKLLTEQANTIVRRRQLAAPGCEYAKCGREQRRRRRKGQPGHWRAHS